MKDGILASQPLRFERNIVMLIRKNYADRKNI